MDGLATFLAIDVLRWLNQGFWPVMGVYAALLVIWFVATRIRTGRWPQ
jgi:hypothetical protein